MAKAQGGRNVLAQRTGLNRESLYKTLSDKGNPLFETINAILEALGYRFVVQRIEQPAE